MASIHTLPFSLFLMAFITTTTSSLLPPSSSPSPTPLLSPVLAPALDASAPTPAQALDASAPTVDELAPTPALDESFPTPSLAPAPTLTLDELAPTPALDESSPTPALDELAPTPALASTLDKSPPTPAPALDKSTPNPAPTLDKSAPTLDESAPAPAPTPGLAPALDESAPTPTLDKSAPIPTLDEPTPIPTLDESTSTPTPAPSPTLSLASSAPKWPPQESEIQPPKDDNLPPPDDINRWCATVPYPGPCKFFMGQKPRPFRPKKKSEFRQMAVQVALNRALAAQTQTGTRHIQCKSRDQWVAWNDCMILYDRTILQLNQTLQGLANSTCSDFDAQTWLSTALTNLETCGMSSLDRNVTHDLPLPHVEYNVSDLISNGLAINEGILGMENGTNSNNYSKFPVWVSKGDRNLLQSRRLLVDGATFVVAKDGSGDFTTVQEAINAAAKMEETTRKIIYVKSGVYRENIWVNPYTNNITLVGDGVKQTLITSARSVKGGFTTYNSATAAFDGILFMARDITFANNAGNSAGQAVAVRSSSDLSVFYRCAFYGYQDTLFVHSQRQFYRQCYIFGTIDIVFGNAAVVFQNSRFYVRKPLTGQANVVTAQGRYDPNQNTGIVIHNCKILPAPDLEPYVGSVATYLGRPWQPYSRTVIMKSYVGELVDSAGWLEWKSKSYLSSLYYAEYKNFGPGSNLSSRVRWPGFHILTNRSAVNGFSVGGFLAGGSWLPSTGVPYNSGL